jgi:hypothetical protein
VNGCTLVVMAAGLASRYGGGKQVDGVGPSGETLLEYSVYDARQAGFSRVVFIIRAGLGESFSTLTKRLPGDLEVQLAEQRLDDLAPAEAAAARTKPWGTVHAVLAARHLVRGAFAVINADDFYGRDAHAVASGACREAEATGRHAMIGLRLDATLSAHGPVTRGLPRVEGGRLRDLEELRGVERRGDHIVAQGSDGPRRLTGAEIASMNYWVFAPAILAEFERQFAAFVHEHAGDPTREFALPDAVGALVREGRAEVEVRQTAGPWFGLTHRDDRPKVMAGLRDLVAQGLYPNPLWG